MPFFRCLIRGDNFPGKLIGQKKLIGFYTTRYVEADSPEQAELLAVEQLRNDPDLEVPSEYRTQDARVFLEEIDEISSEAERAPNKGFTFFVMGT